MYQSFWVRNCARASAATKAAIANLVRTGLSVKTAASRARWITSYFCLSTARAKAAVASKHALGGLAIRGSGIPRPPRALNTAV